MTDRTEQPPEQTSKPARQSSRSLQEKVDAVSVPEDTNLIGTVVDGKYELLQRLGEGGMGHVFRARHVLMGKEFAVKLIHAELAHVNEIAKRFQREAKSSSLLKHPNCISVSDFGTHGDGNVRQLYLVMELLEGEDLDYKLHREKKIEPRLAVNIVSQMLRGLGHAHEKGVIHRDLKPENIFLVPEADGGYHVKILDFGIAKMADAQSDGDKLTKTGVVFGTPKYLSPEQALGDRLDFRADLYSVGVILFEMLTGEPPFTGKTVMDVMSAHLTAVPPKLVRYGSFPRELQRIVQKAMAKKPHYRYKSAAQFLTALENIDYRDISESTIITSHVARTRLLSRIKSFIFSSKRRMIAGLVLFGLCLLTLGYMLLASGTRTPDAQSAIATGDNRAPMQLTSPALAPKDEITELLITARDALDKKDLKAAALACRKALNIDARNPAAKTMYGHVLFASGKHVSAIYQYQNAIDTDASYGKDKKFRANLLEGLQWESIRNKAAQMLAAYGTGDDIDKLTELASSALTDGDVRRAVRTALERQNKADKVDWLSSLQADFRELKGCKDRNAILAQMVKTQNPGFLPFLKKFEITKKRKLRKKHPYACFQTNLIFARNILSRHEGNKNRGKEPPSQ